MTTVHQPSAYGREVPATAAPPLSGGWPDGRPILIVPGIDNSGPDHWQSHWERELPQADRVEQADWASPTLSDWLEALRRAMRARPGAVLVAHSLGCALVAHLVRCGGARGVAGAVLAAPAEVELDTLAGRLSPDFAPMPRLPMPFPSAVVASRDDPFVAIDRARRFAVDWGARFVDAGCAGHINARSGHGVWPLGRDVLAEVLAQASCSRRPSAGRQRPPPL